MLWSYPFQLGFIYDNGFLSQAQGAAADSQANTELTERISCLEEEVTRHREDSEKAQVEVERLLDILREMENEKNDKEKKINELERWETMRKPASASSLFPPFNNKSVENKQDCLDELIILDWTIQSPAAHCGSLWSSFLQY